MNRRSKRKQKDQTKDKVGRHGNSENTYNMKFNILNKKRKTINKRSRIFAYINVSNYNSLYFILFFNFNKNEAVYKLGNRNFYKS